MKAAFFDVDGTLTESRVWSGIFQYFTAHRKRLLTHYYFQLHHYSLYGLHRLGLIDQVAFRSPWARHLSWYFRGYTEAEAAEIWDWVVRETILGQLRDSVVKVLQQHKADGVVTFLVSGGPEGLLKRIAEEVGADHVIGTRHEIVDGTYTGKPAGDACQGENKAKFAKQRIADLGLDVDLSASYAYADSGADIPLMSIVGNPVAVTPDEELRWKAEEQGWEIFPGAGC